MNEEKSCRINEIDYEEREEEPLSPTARTLLHGDPSKTNCHVIGIFGFKKSLDINIVKHELMHNLIKHPRFSSKLVVDENGGKMKWVRTKLNIEDQVIVPNIDPKMANPDEIVQQYISKITKIPIDMSRPLWTCHMLNVKTWEAEALCVFSVHHSLGDGASLMSLLLACCRKASDLQALPTIPKQKKNSSVSSKGFWWWLLLVWNTIVDVLVFMATLLFLKDTKDCLKCVGDCDGEQDYLVSSRRIVYGSVSLEDLKLVKNAMDMTVNDVVLGATQAGLSRYLSRNQKTKKNIRSIICRAVVNVNLRPAKGIQDLADMMSKGSKAKWGNWTGYIFLPLKVTPQNDPLEFVREAKTTMDKKKHSFGAIGTFFITRFAFNTFGVKAGAGIAKRVFGNTTAAFSNVLGPSDEIVLFGQPVSFIAPSVYGVNQVLTIHFTSYVNKMTIIIGVDPRVIPNAKQLCNDIEESFKIIKDAVVQKDIHKINV